MKQHQITLALKLYSDDNDGIFVGYHWFPDKRWPDKLKVYCKSDRLLMNPQFEGHFGDWGYGFAINKCLLSQSFVETDNPIQLFEAVPYIDAADNRHYMFEDSVLDMHSARLYPGATPIGGKWLANARHGGSIVSFYDGSAKWVHASSIPYRGNLCHIKSNEKEFFETNFYK